MDSTQTTKKRQNKDFETLGKILGCKTAAAKMRFYRQNEEAMEMMLKIVEAKESLINENSPKESTNQ
jgi:hypothetical protein